MSQPKITEREIVCVCVCVYVCVCVCEREREKESGEERPERASHPLLDHNMILTDQILFMITCSML